MLQHTMWDKWSERTTCPPVASRRPSSPPVASRRLALAWALALALALAFSSLVSDDNGYDDDDADNVYDEDQYTYTLDASAWTPNT